MGKVKCYLYITFFIVFSFPAFSQCGGSDRIIMNDAVGTNEVLSHMTANAGRFKSTLGNRKYEKLMRLMREGKVEYYGGGTFVVSSGTRHKYASLDEDTFRLLGEVVSNSNAYRAQSSVSTKVRTHQAPAGTHASKEFSVQLRERFRTISQRNDGARVVRQTKDSSRFEVSRGSKIGKALQHLLDSRSSGDINIHFQSSGLVRLSDSSGRNANYSAETINNFLRQASQKLP